MHYTYVGRGDYYRRKEDFRTSARYFLRAFLEWPFSLQPFRFLMTICFLGVLGSTYEEYHRYIKTVLSDLHRYNPKEDRLLYHFLMIPGFRYTFLMRTARYLRSLQTRFAQTIHLLVRYMLYRTGYHFGIEIPYNTDIGDGLYIGHYGGIVVSHKARIGRNCNINHSVTIGESFGGKNPGTPTIGDNVYLGPGSTIIGNITIGNNVMVGANAVVTNSFPDNAVIVGVPARIISFKGASEYVINRV